MNSDNRFPLKSEDFPADVREAHKKSSGHREEIFASAVCGCFYCLSLFKPTDIVSWIDEKIIGGKTALCPKCGIDAVIGDKSGVDVTVEFLSRMNSFWFATSPITEERA